MKLPDDKAERTKILMLGGIGVVATIYVLVQYAIIPLNKSNKINTQRITEITGILEQSERDVAMLTKNSGRNIKALEKIVRISKNHVLHPSLGGNYSLNAATTLEDIERKSKMELGASGASVSANIPGASIPAGSDLKSYSVRLSFSGSLKELTDTLNTIKKINPYLGIKNLTISAVGKTPEKHAASFTLSWLIWRKPEMRQLIEKQLLKEKKPKGVDK
ncbi:MAG: hypothetical protein KAH23_08505 [Kiritimatiellae bacterium]|nr:hypothetical protein [Kiritimatiellia bacterium]